MAVAARLLACGLALAGCSAEPQAQRPIADGLYLAVSAAPHEAYPEAGVRGSFRIVDGCALLGEALLIFPYGARLASRPGEEAAILFPGDPPRRLAQGYVVRGGGGHFPFASFTGPGADWPLRQPIPERCARIANGGTVVGPGAAIHPPSRYADPLYAAVEKQALDPPTLAPVGGTLRVEDQCLMLGDRLLVLPAQSHVEFLADGTLAVHIADSGYRETVRAVPGNRIAGSGAGLTAESGPIPAMPRPLLAPIPKRCRPAGRRGVILNPRPEVTPGRDTGYRDAAAAGLAITPPPAPPPPPAQPARAAGTSRQGSGFPHEKKRKAR